MIQQMIYELCKKGDDYICTCCNQTFYQHSVYSVTRSNYIKKNDPNELLDIHLTNSASNAEWICKTCHKYLMEKKTPPMSKNNGLTFPEIPQHIKTLHPTPTEERCCSLRIPFMQIKELGIGKQYGIFGNTVNVPMNPAEVVSALPRRITDTATIQLNFMRRTCYKKTFLHETIRPKVIYDITKHFIETSDLYKEEHIQLNVNWLQEFEDKDEINYVTNPSDSEHSQLNDDQSFANNASHNSKEKDRQTPLDEPSTSRTCNADDEWEEVSENDQICGNADTLLNHNDFTDDGRHALKLAPGEKSHPFSLFLDKYAEEKSFPILFNGQKKPEHPIPVTYATICKAQLRSADRRFSKSIPNTFFKLKKLQAEQVKNSISTAPHKMKGDKRYTAADVLDDINVKNIISSDEGYKILRSLRSSPAFFQQKQKELFAMIRTLGIPTFFATFSAAETKWTDLLSLLYKKVHGSLPTDEQLEGLTFMDKCKLIQQDPVTCARHFQYKTHLFFNNVLLTSLSPLGNMIDYFYRVEFQNRGSPHMHCLFWIQNSPIYEEAPLE